LLDEDIYVVSVGSSPYPTNDEIFSISQYIFYGSSSGETNWLVLELM
jgi:hypothetical protein